MISRLEVNKQIDASETLAMLQNAFDQQAPAEEVIEERRASQRARQPRILDMHLVPQMKLAEAALAFSCLEPGFSVNWKQQVRQLRNQITHFDDEVKEREQGRLQVVGLLSVRGGRPRKGIAGNLAFSLAAMEETKVLLIDAKVSKPDLDQQLGLTEAKGLCEATRAHREDLPDCLRRISGTHLYLMPFGQSARYEGEPVDVRGFQRLLAGLRKQFDWIIIDGPGFDTPADAGLVTLSSDGTIYFVEQGVDHFEDLRLAFKQTQGRYMVGAVMI